MDVSITFVFFVPWEWAWMKSPETQFKPGDFDQLPTIRNLWP
jgi:hypothetical protein